MEQLGSECSRIEDVVATDPLFTPDPIAEKLGITVQALALMRHEGSGPTYIKVGRRVRYRMSDVEAWLDANTVTTSGDAA